MTIKKFITIEDDNYICHYKAEVGSEGIIIVRDGKYHWEKLVYTEDYTVFSWGRGDGVTETITIPTTVLYALPPFLMMLHKTHKAKGCGVWDQITIIEADNCETLFSE